MVRLGQCAWGAAGLMRLDCSRAGVPEPVCLDCSRAVAGAAVPGLARAAAPLTPLAYRSIWAISRAQ